MKEVNLLMSGSAFNTIDERRILTQPCVNFCPPQPPKSIRVSWCPPYPGWIKVNTNASSVDGKCKRVDFWMAGPFGILNVIGVDNAGPSGSRR